LIGLYAGVPIIFLVIGLISALIYCFKKCPKTRKIFYGIKDVLFMKTILKTYQMAYLGLLIKSKLQYLIIDVDKLEVQNIPMFVGILLGPIVVFFIMLKYSNVRLKRVTFKKVWKDLYIDIDLKIGMFAKLWMAFFFLRRLTLIFGLLGPCPSFLLNLCTLVWMIYLLSVKPFKDKGLFYIELFNETTLYLLSYF
jgi:hypothetical protein